MDIVIELQNEIDALKKQIAELTTLVNTNQSRITDWDNFQLKEPLDAYTQRIIANFGNGNVTASSIGLGNVDNTSDATKNSAVATLTNKRFVPRVYTTANNASLTPNKDNYDIYHLTAMSANTTINNPSTSLNDGEAVIFRFLDNGSARTLTWGTAYVAKAGIALPTTTIAGKNLISGFLYDANLAKLNLVAQGQES